MRSKVTRAVCSWFVIGAAGFSGTGETTAEAAAWSSRPDAASESARQRALALIEVHAFSALPTEQQRLITQAGLAPTAGPLAADPCAPGPWNDLPRLGDDDYRVVERVVSRAAWDRMMPVHQHALRDLVVRRAAGEEVPSMCFAPGTDPELVDAFNRVVYAGIGLRFQQVGRWTATAMQPGPLAQGQPTTLTYSFPPDGTTCPTLTSGTTQPSNLFAFLNGIYGSPDVWQPIYAQVFARWSQVCNVHYVFEPNDDGVPIGSAAGVAGVRGDLRLSGTGLDGPSNVLAFNYFPNNGDQVIDTADTFFNTITTNSLRLRNVLAHEHGHGLGMAHVCPSNQTKLMEPFVSVAYDGPQVDDILNGQRFYGDVNEPNNTPATATAIPAATAQTQTIRQVSCDDRADVDLYRLTLPGAGLLVATVRPITNTYIQGPQTSACDSGSSYNAALANDLAIQVLGADGSSSLAMASGLAAGQPETAYAVLAAGQDVFLRVSAGASPAIQGYELDYRLASPPAIELALPQGAPTVVSPNLPTSFPVRVITAGDTVVPGTARLFYRTSPAFAFASTPLFQQPDGSYQARIPAAGCTGTPQFYIEVSGAAGGRRSLPATAPTATFTASASTTVLIRRDTFDTDTGWASGAPDDTATTGQWVRGDPIGTTAQPEDDSDDPGVQCWFTGQGSAGGQPGEADVDGGKTTLLSPIIDLTGLAGSPHVAYRRWFSNSAGSGANDDTFLVDVSNDGGSNWTNLETVGPTGAGTTGGWIAVDLDIASRIPLTNQMRFRFVAQDLGTPSLVEAAVDDFQIRFTNCRETCRGDFNGDRSHTVQDIFDFLRAYFAGQPAADFNADAEVSVQDIFVFLAGWFGPCP